MHATTTPETAPTPTTRAAARITRRLAATTAGALVIGVAALAGPASAALPPPPDLGLATPPTTPDPDISIDDVTHAEGTGGATAFHFTVSLSAPSDEVVTAKVLAADGTATEDVDFVAPTTPIAFQPGETTKGYAVSVVGDDQVEPDEVFAVMVEDIVGAGLGDTQGLGTITDDDVPGEPQAPSEGPAPDPAPEPAPGPGPARSSAPDAGAGSTRTTTAAGEGAAAGPVSGPVVEEPDLPLEGGRRAARGEAPAPPRPTVPAGSVPTTPGPARALGLALVGLAAAGSAGLVAWYRRDG